MFFADYLVPSGYCEVKAVGEHVETRSAVSGKKEHLRAQTTTNQPEVDDLVFLRVSERGSNARNRTTKRGVR